MEDWKNEWTVTCIRLRLMMMKRGIESIPITCEPGNEIEAFIKAMEKTRANWKAWKERKIPPLRVGQT